MSNTPMEERFIGASTAYIPYCAYVDELIKSIGKERTFELLSSSEKSRGTRVGKSVKEENPDVQYDLKKVMETIVEMASQIAGIDKVIELNDQRAVTVTEFGKCPVYEAAHSFGIPDEQIEELCRAGSLVFLDNVVKQLNPNLTYKVREFRSEKYKGCVEEIVFHSADADKDA